MKSINKIIQVFFLVLISSGILAAQKKPTIVLYDDGTWENVDINSTTKSTMTISETWSEFQKSVISKDQKSISNFFNFPFTITYRAIQDYAMINDKPEHQCLPTDYCQMEGATSKSKLEKNFDLLFNEKLIKSVKTAPNDEYTENNSSGQHLYTFDIKHPSQIVNFIPVSNGIYQKKIIDAFTGISISFALINGEYKIVKIYFEKLSKYY